METFENSFLDTLAQTKKKDPLRPIVVLVGSNLLGIHLRHSLSLRHGGSFNVRFLTFVDLARQLLNDNTRTPFPLGAEEIMLEELTSNLSEKSLFYSVSKQRGFHQALQKTFHDLIDGGVTTIPIRKGKLGEIAELFEAHRKNYIGHFFTTADLILEASFSKSSFSSLFGTDQLYCYGFYDFTEAQRRLLTNCSHSAKFHVWTPIQTSSDFFKTLSPMRLEVRNDTTPSPHIEILSAPGEYNEAEEIVRSILAYTEKKPMPLHRIGILLREADKYFTHFADVLCRAQLPFYREGGIPLHHTRLGQAVLQVIDLLESAWNRSRVMEALSIFPFQNQNSLHTGSPPDWDRWSREALVSHGKESFMKKLSFLPQHEERSNFIPFFQKWIDGLTKLEETTKSWKEFGNSFAQFIHTHAEECPEREKVERVARSLQDLSQTNLKPNLKRLSRILRDRIARETISGGIFERDGIFLGSLVSARSIPFEFLAIPGLVERSFPAPPRPDPLLLDNERILINELMKGGISLKENRLKEERILFQLTTAQAKDKLLLSYPRFDLSHSKERNPSPFLAEFTQRSSVKFTSSPLLRWNLSKERALLDRRDWLSKEIGSHVLNNGETEISELIHWLPLGQAVSQWVSNRLGRQHWTVYDGLVEFPSPQKEIEKPYSASELSDYATCPYRYYLKHILGLSLLEDPDEVMELRPLDRGNLVHHILFNFFTTLKNQGLLPFRSEKRREIEQLLTQLAEKTFEEAETRLPLGPTLLWNEEKASLLSDLQSILEMEFKDSSIFIPTDFEIRFGMRSRGKEEGELSTDLPALFEEGREKVAFRGRVDRFDLSKDGKRARIIDYKTGTLQSGKDNRFEGGKKLQLPIYLLALQTFAPKVDLNSSEAFLLATAYGAGVRKTTFSGAVLESRRKEFLQILTTLVRGIRNGLFPPIPKVTLENCRTCDFTKICGKGVGRIFERKQTDPSIAPLLSLSEIP